jgi:DNA-binding transcriptional LysR family regulator
VKVKYFDENVYKKLTMNLAGMTLHQLKFILAVARHGSLVRAAKALSLSTPTLSLQLKKLSETAGAPLFEMLGKKLYLTSTGELMLRCAQDIEGRIEELSQEIAGLKGLKEGELKVAILTTLKYTVPRLVGSFCVNYPGINISLWIGNREALLDRLRKNEDDLYVMGQPPDELNVVAEQFAPNPLVLVAHPSNPIAKKRLVKPSPPRASSKSIGCEYRHGLRL